MQLLIKSHKDFVGVVPEGVIPRYCDYLFPEEKILTFMNLPWEESNVIEKSVIWYPIRESQFV